MATFIDMKEFDDRLPALVDPVIEFIRRHTNMEVVISGKAKRDEYWDYPLPALREAIVNAIVHRDYHDPGNVQVRVFDDRLEVWSPGLLPKELNIKTIGTEHRSIPRNRKISEIFHALRVIEGWGSGIARIIEWSRNNGNDDPIFKESAGAFVVTFARRSRGGVNGGVSGGVNDVEPLLQYIESHPGYHLGVIADALQVPAKTLEKRIAKLRKAKQIEFRGSPKTGGYYAIEQSRISPNPAIKQ